MQNHEAKLIAWEIRRLQTPLTILAIFLPISIILSAVFLGLAMLGRQYFFIALWLVGALFVLCLVLYVVAFVFGSMGQFLGNKLKNRLDQEV